MEPGHDADLEVVEAEGFGGVGVEPVAHHHGPAHHGEQQNHAHPDPRPVGRGHLPEQTQSAARGHGSSVPEGTPPTCGGGGGASRGPWRTWMTPLDARTSEWVTKRWLM